MSAASRAQTLAGFALLCVLTALTALSALSQPLAAQESPAREEILSFQSHLLIHPDGSLDVIEHIEVRALGEQIRRGIYRDFPLDYRGPFFTRVQVPFEVLEVQRDGEPESWHTEGQTNGMRVYIGREGVFLQPGVYTYTLHYRTGRQLGFFDDHDELYWNVTGNGWSFPILEASARVALPPAIPRDRITHEGYTGTAGSEERALVSETDANGDVRFRATRPLRAGEGLTVVVGFPKGFVAAPTGADRRRDFFAANRILAAGLMVLLLVAAYYLTAWILVGRDPRRGTIIPLFEPPDGMPPACVRFVRRMGYDRKCFTAAVVDMAVRGFARIEEGKSRFSLHRTGDDTAVLSPGEKQIAKHLLSGKSFDLKKSRSAAKRMSKATKGLKNVLKLEYEGQVFHRRRGWFIAGLAFSLAGLVAAAALGPPEAVFGFLFMVVWLSVWTLGVFGLGAGAASSWREVFRREEGLGKVGALFSALIATAFFIPFAGAEVMALFMLSMLTSPWFVLVLLLVIGLNVVFYTLLRQPTGAGQAIRDRIEGFRLYLETAEGDELRGAAPDLTPERYQRLLPYAIALDVENEWSHQFDRALERSGQQPAEHQPTWYSGTSWSHGGAAALAGAIGGGMTAAIASASTAPGSSSGGGGGGSSGGGGGGGGGGGW